MGMSEAEITRKLSQIRQRRRARQDLGRQDEDGYWVTTENGHKIHIGEGGKPDKGNPHVLSAMEGKGKKEKPRSSTKKKPAGSSKVDISKFKFKDCQNPDGARTPGMKTYKEALQTWSDRTEKEAEKAIKTYWGGTPPAKQMVDAFASLNGHSGLRDIRYTSQQSIKDAVSEIAKRQEYLIEEAKKYTKWNGQKKQWE